MDITSKSLHHSNIVFVFAEGKFLMPENAAILSLYQGQVAAGATFADDAVLRTKVLNLPRLKLQIGVELNRLRVDDNSQQEPNETTLVNEALSIYPKLFPQTSLIGLGFNFDIYYQFREFIRLKDFFELFAEPKILEKADLRDLGVQFTLEKEGGKKRETYFLKITAPLEIAVHINHHFATTKIPDQSALQKLFEQCYNESDEIIQNLKF
jgi:hypothetical protein